MHHDQPFPDDAHELAYRFAARLQRWLTPAQLAAVNLANATETNPGICHTHDVCDPNQAIIDALAEMGRECDPQDEQQSLLIDFAWTIARAAEFDHHRIFRESDSAISRKWLDRLPLEDMGPTFADLLADSD